MSDFYSYQSPAAKAPAPAPSADAQAILADLSSEDWEQFIGFAARRRYPAGAVLVRAGETDRALCFIASGQIELRLDSGVVAVRSEGAVVGVMSFLDGAPSAATISVGAAAPAELLRLTPEALQQLSAWQPRIALALMRDLGSLVAARLRRLQPGD